MKQTPETRPQIRSAPTIAYRADGTATAWYPPLDERATPGLRAIAMSAQREALTQCQVSFCATSVAVAARLQLGSIFSMSASGEGKAIFYDAVATTDFYTEATETSGEVLYALRHGVGVRLALRATKLTVETNLSFSMVAAQARQSGAEVAYEVQGIGIPPDIVKSMLGALKTSGPLTESSYTKLDSVLRDELPKYLDDTSLPLTVGEYIVAPRTRHGDSATQRARVFNFALTHLARGRSLSKALSELADDEVLNTDTGRFLTTYTYARYAGVTDPGSKESPTDHAIARARAWLNI